MFHKHTCKSYTFCYWSSDTIYNSVQNSQLLWTGGCSHVLRCRQCGTWRRHCPCSWLGDCQCILYE